MTLQAVFFDMGGTIETFWHDRELRLEATHDLRQILLDAGIDLNLNVEQLYTVVTKGLGRYKRWCILSLFELPPARVWREFILTDYQIDPLRLEAVAEDLAFFIETRYYRREMRPEMPGVLEAIQKMGLKMGVISNVMSRGQVPGNLERYGIKHFFDPIVMSSVYGRRKPGPAIFHHAASLAGVPTGACVHVGDRIARDIVGARRAGYHAAIQIRHPLHADEKDNGTLPNAVLVDMTELVEVLENELRYSKAKASMSRANRRQVKAVLFDAGDLLYHRPNKRKHLDAFLQELDLNPSGVMPEDRDMLKNRAFCGEITQTQFREELLKLYGVRGREQIERGKRILEEEGNDIRFFDGVRDTLISLEEQGFLLGIVTDTAHPIYVKLGWFDQAGIGHVWDAIVSSAKLGVRKPDPRIYEAALRQLGVQPSEAIFVGHMASELEGAKAVGMKTVAFNWDDDAEADNYIEHFADLLKLPAVSQT